MAAGAVSRLKKIRNGRGDRKGREVRGYNVEKNGSLLSFIFGEFEEYKREGLTI